MVLAERLGAQDVCCRFFPLNDEDDDGDDGNTGGPVWEAECLQQRTTVREFCEWLTAPQQTPDESALRCVPRTTFWGYLDYAHFVVLLDGTDRAAQQERRRWLDDALRWAELGIRDKTAEDATLWCGSRGAETPGHYDTYGYNVVVQLWGEKEWLLAPPCVVCGGLRVWCGQGRRGGEGWCVLAHSGSHGQRLFSYCCFIFASSTLRDDAHNVCVTVSACAYGLFVCGV